MYKTPDNIHISRYINGISVSQSQLTTEHKITEGGAMSAITAALKRASYLQDGSADTNTKHMS
ncbi:MAG: hypothetical protein IKV96_03250 [Firmicutes bacterium]|nr:hypothetical protein [Bacillota bacterium]